MAILIYGKTECLLCGKPIYEGQEIVAFSPFVSNELDPLWVFNDCAFHTECFNEHPLAEEAQARYKEVRERHGPGNRFCVVCKKEIFDPDNYFAVGHLVEDVFHPLYRYNYMQAHRSCLPKWAELSYFYELLEDLRQSGNWLGKNLDEFLAELRNASPFTLPEVAN
ncbi:MAG: hypothetical protein ACJ74Q_23020 [Pyrinomonadaceae bacterium]